MIPNDFKGGPRPTTPAQFTNYQFHDSFYEKRGPPTLETSSGGSSSFTFSPHLGPRPTKPNANLPKKKDL